MQQHHYRTHYPGAEFYSVLERGAVIGRLYVDRSAVSEIRLIDIAFADGKRGQGLGGAFLQALGEMARTSARVVGLHVEENNPARRLYQRLGFVDVEPRPPYLYMTWTP
jgi:ribosomal protein S18 acetylase RimI-like enzyme